MHLLGEFDRLPLENLFSGGAQMNYVGIDHHRQYSHMTLMDQGGQRQNPLWEDHQSRESLVAGHTDSDRISGFSVVGKKPGWTGNIHTQLLSAVRKEYRGRSI
jgi:hypothetical protein